MQKRVILVEPSMRYEKEVLEMKQEFLDNKEKKIPGSSILLACNNYLEFCEYCRKNKSVAQHGQVTSSTFLSIDEKTNKLVGFVSVKHELDEYLEKNGGHVRMSVRPKERNKGYGKAQLKEAIQFCKKLGIENVLLMCLAKNKAAHQLIVSCGGKLEDTIFNETKQQMMCRFWAKEKKKRQIYASKRNI